MSEIDSLEIKITASATKADQALDRLVNTLNETQNALRGTNAQADKLGSGKGLSGAANTYNQKVKTATKSTFSFAKAIGTFYANYYLIVRGVKALGNAIKETADYFEAFNYFNVALGKIGSDWKDDFEEYGYSNAEIYAKSFATRLTEELSTLSGLQMSYEGTLATTDIKNLGLNIQEITQFSAQLASVTNSVGQVGEVSLATSGAFTKLASDMSSLFNVDYSQVATNLSSALIGQSRSVYKYGIDITNATLQTYAYSLGVEKAVSEMTQAEKMQLRLIAILDQSRVAWGDQANTINSLANQMRILENNMSEISLVLGQLFVPLMERVMPIVNGLTTALKRMFVNIAGILGVKIDTSNFGQGYSDIEDEFENQEDQIDKNKEALEEYKNQLLGFDEVNKLQEPSNSDGSGAISNNIDLTKEILAATEEYERVWQEAYNRMESNAEQWATYFEKFTEPFEKIIADISVGDFFKLGEDITEPVNKLQEWIQRVIKKVNWNKIGESFADFFQGSASKSFGTLGEGGETVKEASKGVSTLMSSAIDKINFGELVDKFVSGVREFLKKVKIREIMSGITDVVNSIVGAITELFIGALVNTPMLSLALTKFLVEAIVGSIETAISSLANVFTSTAQAIADRIVPVDENFKIKPIEYTISVEAEEWLEKTNQLADSYERMQEANEDLLSGKNDMVNYLETIAEKYFELAEKESLTAEEQLLLNTYRRELIKGNQEFGKILNNNTLSYQEQKDAIYDVIEALKKESKIKALQGILTNLDTQIYEDLFALENFDYDHLNTLKIQEESLQRQLDHWKKLRDSQTDPKAREHYQNMVNETAVKINSIHREIASLEESLGIIENRISKNEALYEQYAAELAYVSSGNEALTDSNKDLAESFEGVGEAVDPFLNFANGIGASSQHISSALRINIETPLDRIAEKARQSGANAGNNFGDAIRNSIENSTKKVQDSINKFSSGFSSIVDNFRKVITGKFSIDSFSSLGLNVLKGIEKGVNNKAEQNKTTSSIASFAASIGQKFANVLGIHSPSRVFQEFGQFTIEGFNIGVEDMFSDSYRLMANWGTNLQKNARTSLDGLTMATNDANFSTFANQTYSSDVNVDNSEEVALLRQQNALLTQLLQKENTIITPDTDNLFKVVQNKANNYTRQTGQPAFII